MRNIEKISVVYRLLKLYGVAGNGKTSDIKNFKSYKSSLYGMQDVYRFDYLNRHFYVTNDYSLMDSPEYIKALLEEIKPLIKGGPIKNPVLQSDGAQYASSLDGTEYYLWEETAKLRPTLKSLY